MGGGRREERVEGVDDGGLEREEARQLPVEVRLGTLGVGVEEDARGADLCGEEVRHGGRGAGGRGWGRRGGWRWRGVGVGIIVDWLSGGELKGSRELDEWKVGRELTG